VAEEKRKGRPRSGSLYWTKSGWRARATIDVDGVAVQKSFDLETRDKQVARIKLRRLVQANGAPSELQAEAARTETTTEAIRRVVAQQGREGLKTWNERLARLERYAVPEIGALPIDEVRPGDIRDLLERAGETLSKQSVTHVRNDLGTVFGALWRDEMIPENPVRRVKLPKGLRVDRRPRVILTDDEFARFCAHPSVPERLYLMAVTSRSFGGMRTSDLHAWDWSHIDVDALERANLPSIDGPAVVVTAKVYRPKTDGADADEAVLAELEMPEIVRAPLYAWWTRATSDAFPSGKPTTGPVFPVVKGKRAGERQGKRSHVRELRRCLWEAGVHRPLDGLEAALQALRKAEEHLAKLRADEAKGDVRKAQRARLAALEAAQALDAIQAPTERTRPADFHSFRRAFNTALAAVGLNVQQAMALAGHRDARTHMRYVDLVQRGALPVPAAALPKGVSASPVLKLPTAIRAANDDPAEMVGDPSENRTRVTGVRGRCPNR
jgi:integrase